MDLSDLNTGGNIFSCSKKVKDFNLSDNESIEDSLIVDCLITASSSLLFE